MVLSVGLRVMEEIPRARRAVPREVGSVGVEYTGREEDLGLVGFERVDLRRVEGRRMSHAWRILSSQLVHTQRVERGG